MRLGGSGAGDGASEDNEAGAERAARVPVIVATPLEDYTRAHVKYPAEAVDALASGEVRLELDIDERGHVTRVKVRQRAGYGFDELATGLAEHYRFRPARDADGEPIASRMGWRMVFAEWHPVQGGSNAPEARASPVALEGRAQSDGDVPKVGASLREQLDKRSGTLQQQPRRPTREEVEARPIAMLTEPEREELCRWQIRLRGGAQGHRCAADETREDMLSNMVGGTADPNRGRWIVPGELPWLSSRVSNRQIFGAARDEVFVFVKGQPECVRETHAFDECSVTVGEYASCMVALAKRPCDWARIAACARITARCD